MQKLTQQVIHNLCGANMEGQIMENCCNCISTSAPIKSIENGRIQINSTTFIGCMIIDGIRYFDAEQLCNAYGWSYDLTVVPMNSIFSFEFPNIISYINQDNEKVEINIGKEMKYINTQGISALCMNTLNNLKLQPKDEAIEVNPLPFEPQLEEGSDS